MYKYLLAIVAVIPTSASAGVSPNGPDLQASEAKCAALGYAGRPDLLAACVRAMRADYCGDGTAHTSAGTLINLYDRAGIQVDATDWRPEAEWTASGASCVASESVMRHGRNAPACKVPVRASCGVKVGDSSVMVTEI